MTLMKTASLYLLNRFPQVSNETKQIRHHHKRLHSRDKKRSKQRALPFTIESIVKAPVDTFNEMLVFSGLTEAQVFKTPLGM